MVAPTGPASSRSGPSSGKVRAIDYITGKLVGGVTFGEVIANASAAAGSPYQVVQGDDGRSSVQTNTASKTYIEQRKAASERRLAQAIKERDGYMATRAKHRKRKTAIDKMLRAKKKLTPALRREYGLIVKALANLVDLLDTVETEIQSLGGQITADTDTLTEPTIDNSNIDEAAVKDAEQKAKDAENLRRQALGMSSLEDDAQLAAINAIRAQYGLAPVASVSEIGSPTSAVAVDTSSSLYNPTALTSASAQGALSDSVNRLLPQININGVQDPNAVAARVAFILGSTRLRAGGAM